MRRRNILVSNTFHLSLAIKLKQAYYNRQNEKKRNETKFCEILRNTAKYCEILRNMKKYGQITTKNAKILKPYHKYSLPWTQCGRQSSHGHTEKAEVCTTD